MDLLVKFNPTTAQEYKINETYVFELNLSKIIDAPKQMQHYEVISKYPAITRDVALLVLKRLLTNKYWTLFKGTKQKYLTDVKLFDVYAGNHLDAGTKSLAYQLTYQDRNATLQEDTVNQEFAKVVETIRNPIRSKQFAKDYNLVT